MLPILTPVLKHACHNLRSITLHMGYSETPVMMGYQNWIDPRDPFPLTENDDVPGDQGKTTEQKIYDAVGALVEALPGLQELQLGDYKQAEIPHHDLQREEARKWMKIVKERLERLKAAELVKTFGGVHLATVIEELGLL